MKNWTVDNLLYLRQHYPNLYHLVRNRDRDNVRYPIENSKSGKPIILWDGGPTALHSKYDPDHEAVRWLENNVDQIHNMKHLIVFGFGAGYHIEKLLEKNTDTNVYIFEPDIELFMAAMEARDLKSLLNSPNIVSIGIGSEQAAMNSFLMSIFNFMMESANIVYLPVYKKIMSDQLNAFMSEMQKGILDYRGNLATTLRYQREWTENIVLNLRNTIESPPLLGLENKCKGTPALIVGSGPSLEQDIELLRECKKHMLVIAAGSSVQALLRRGIKPHLLISFDGSEANQKVFEDLDLQGIPFLYSPTIKYKIIDQTKADLIHFVLQFDTITEYLLGLNKEYTRFLSSTTVTGLAIQVAQYLGCEQIIFAGQDLSYPNRKYYSTGINHLDEDLLRIRVEGAKEVVENVNGGKNPTSQRMLNTLRDIEKYVFLFKDRIEFINTSAMGAQIEGTVFRSLSEILMVSTPVSHHEDWFIEVKDLHLERVNEHQKQRVVRKCKKVYSNIVELTNHANNLMVQISALKDELKTLNMKRVQSLTNDIELAWDSIRKSKEFVHIYQFTMQGFITSIARIMPHIRSEHDPITKAELIVKHLGGFVHQVCKVSTFLIQTFETALKRLEQGSSVVIGEDRE